MSTASSGREVWHGHSPSPIPRRTRAACLPDDAAVDHTTAPRPTPGTHRPICHKTCASPIGLCRRPCADLRQGGRGPRTSPDTASPACCIRPSRSVWGHATVSSFAGRRGRGEVEIGEQERPRRSGCLDGPSHLHDHPGLAKIRRRCRRCARPRPVRHLEPLPPPARSDDHVMTRAMARARRRASGPPVFLAISFGHSDQQGLPPVVAM